MKRCFVILSMNDKLIHHYNNIIKPSIELCGYYCSRIDTMTSSENNNSIIQNVKTADIILLNLTNLDKDFFFELCTAHTFTSNILMIAQKGQEIPCDQRDYPIFYYDTTEYGVISLQTFLKDSLKNPSAISSSKNPLAYYASIINNLRNFKGCACDIENNRGIGMRLYQAIQSKPSFSYFHPIQHVISISGPVAVGKSTFAHYLQKLIQEQEGENAVSVVPLDAYMLPRRLLLVSKVPNGFDDENWDIHKAENDIRRLVLNGTPFILKTFNHKTGNHDGKEIKIIASKYIILEGIYSFHSKISQYSTMKIFISGKTVCEEQNVRIKIAIHERGYSMKNAIKMSDRETKDYHSYLLSKRADADVWLVMKNGLWNYDIFFDYPAPFLLA